LKSKKSLVPLTKLSPSIVEKYIEKTCGKIKNITTFGSGVLLFETHRMN
jgi:hypothetical protein